MGHSGGGLWELFIPELGAGTAYKYEVRSVDYAAVVGNLSSPFFGRPVAADPSRRFQISAGFSF